MAILHHKRAMARRIAVGDDRVSRMHVGAMTRAAIAAQTNRSRTPERLYLCDTLLKWLAQDLKDMVAELGQFIRAEHAMVGQQHVARHRHVASADQPRIRDGMVRRATSAGRDQRRTVPVRPATLWMRVVSRASARVMAGRLVVRRRATSSGPLQEGQGGGRYRQNACITFSFTIASRGVEGHHR
jgi:hypothetical protein